MRPRGRDAGAVIIEGAIAMTVLAVLFIGTIEYGFAWRQATVIEKAVQQSARAAGNMADQAPADYETLQAFRSVFGSSKNVTLERLVIYRSTRADGAPPPDCMTASVPNVCNRYVAADLGRPASDFGTCVSPSPDRFWCPAARERDRAPTPDYVGVYARLQYAGVTGSITGGITIERKAVYALEPCAFGLPGC